MPSLPRVVTVAILLLTSLPVPAAIQYRITDLGDLLKGGGFSYANGINDAGQVVGSTSARDGVRAFRWTAGSGMQNLGVLPGGRFDSGAQGINNVGDVVGQSGSATGERAFLWTAAGGMQNLGVLPGGNPAHSVAFRINNAGQVVGRSPAPTGQRAFLWTAGGGMQNLGDLPEGPDLSTANGINNAGRVVGLGYTAAGSRAFLWTAGVMQDLGVLPRGGADPYSYAGDINDVDQVVGAAGHGPAGPGSGPDHAFLWTAGAGMRDLGILPEGSELQYYAAGINEHGYVVGSSRTPVLGGGNHAFLWTEAGGMQDLDTLIDPLDPLRTVTTLLGASDMNNAGQIVGYGLINGKQHAYLLSPVPEPASGALTVIGLGLVGLMMWRPHRRH